MRLTLPADSDSAITEVGAIAALLDKSGWKAAAVIAVAVKPMSNGGDRRFSGRSATGRLSPTAFAKGINAKGWSRHVIERYYDAWERAAAAGLVAPAADLMYGQKIDLPADGWSEFYPPRWDGDEEAEAVAAQAVSDGARIGSKAVDIAQNPKAMASAIKASPAARAAAAQALVDAGALETLSKATAAVAQNRQVERNRKRREEGMRPQPQVGAGIPSAVQPKDAGLAAFMSVKGLSEALRALVTTFPREWAGLPDAAREDEDYVENCAEMCDKIEIALANVRLLISGGVSDSALERLLEGA